MRVARSLILSALLVHPGVLLPQTSSKEGNKDKKTAQEPQAPTPRLKEPLEFGLEDATPVKLRLNRTISSADAHVDDKVDFDVLEEIKVHDIAVIPRGSIAWATVTQAQHKKRMGRGGKLNVNIDAVRLATGEKVPLRAVKEAQGGGHVGAMTGAIVATTIVFFPAAPFFLFMHGKDITIPKGTEITAYINGDIPLDPAKFRTQTPPKPEGAAPAVPSPAVPSGPESGNSMDASLSRIEVKSTPDGAEITADEKYMGSTPATLRLSAGDHKVKIEKPGFKPWERILSVSAGATVTIDATLEKQ